MTLRELLSMPNVDLDCKVLLLEDETYDWVGSAKSLEAKWMPELGKKEGVIVLRRKK